MNPVMKACIRLLHELKFEEYLDHPYCVPYINYVMSWSQHLPIKTIIIGQNPYPQHIYPEYGSALAYDLNKCKRPTGSVAVLAEDLFNYDKTPKSDTIDCFRESWRLLELGILMINETVFQRICDNKNRLNTGPVREMETQVRAIQILVAESYFLGQESFTCIGMGTSGAMMTNIIRQWFPKDLISSKVITCSNPAAFARELGDFSSQAITIKKTAVSKVLSEIVKSYKNMAPAKSYQADKRRQQHIDALKAASEEVKAAGSTELRSFESRLRDAKKDPAAVATLDELADSIGSCADVIDRFKNATTSYNMVVIMALSSMPKQQDDKVTSSDAPPYSSGSTPAPRTPPPTKGPRRRVAVKSSPMAPSPAIESIKEENLETISVQSLSMSPSRARRRIVKAPASVADTEYTADSTQDTQTMGSNSKISEIDSVNMKSFATWCERNISDPTYAEMLRSSASDYNPVNELCTQVLEYIRLRKSDNSAYDAFDELDDEHSDSSMWISKLIANAT